MLKLLLISMIAISIGCKSTNDRITEANPSILYQQNDSSIMFAAIGDYGKDNRDERDVANLIESHSPEFIITMGDNNYPSGCMNTIDDNVGRYFHQYIYNYNGRFGDGSPTRRFFPTLGNHDWYAIEDCPYQSGLPFVAYFDLPGNERYYDFVKGPVHFFALDSDSDEPDGNRIGSIQYRWLNDRARASTARFKVAYFHHAPFSSGKHGSYSKMQWDFSEMGIDLVLAGHDHSYERIERNEIIYIVNGLGGARPYDRDGYVRGSKKFYNREHGALFISADQQQLKGEFINHRNELIDDFVITKAE